MNTSATTCHVLILAPPGEWLDSDDEDPSPSEGVRETWLSPEETMIPGPVDAIVASPSIPASLISLWLHTRPDAAIIMIVSPREGGEDPRVRDFFGDDRVFFLYDPPSIQTLRTGLREILAYREGLAGGASERPELEEHKPVSGWFELTAPSHPVFLRRFRAWLEVLGTLPLEGAERRRLIHAVREVGWNAIEWGNGHDPRRKLELSFLAVEEKILFRIQTEERGENWYAERVRDRDPATRQRERAKRGVRPGGLGLDLVEKVVDRLEVSSHGHAVILEKRLQREPVGEGVS